MKNISSCTACHAYLVELSRFSERPGVPGRITGIEFVFRNGVPVLHYRVKYDDGTKLFNAGRVHVDYRLAIVSEHDVMAGNIPALNAM